ncbi:hypothetical protein BGZ80_000850 [Entomortierella chlamydospora]|uniref:Uncharacterized protein n=1 Tax=Entomortierella chlamydospora TaxID=101097 RepID=A0A9P6SY50_9FUNG|nr:hypothetical protein BGZ80_000850 [Entomortierella chlamydospora]
MAVASRETTHELLSGLMYHNGDGAPRDPTKAAEWYLKAANQGDADAEFILGILHRNGYGILTEMSGNNGAIREQPRNGSQEQFSHQQSNSAM